MKGPLLAIGQERRILAEKSATGPDRSPLIGATQ